MHWLDDTLDTECKTISEMKVWRKSNAEWSLKLKSDDRQTKDKNGVTEIKSKRCAIRLLIGEKKKKNIAAIFEEGMTKNSQNLSKTPLQKLRWLTNSN